MSATVMAAMPAVLWAAELMAKSATVRGAGEGQSPEKGKAKSSGLDPSPEGPSGPENLVRTPGTGSSGKVAASLGPLAGLAGPVETLVSSMGPAVPAVPAERRLDPSAISGRISEQE